jgi:DNA-binding Xre family transcriptional regulator
MEGLMYYSVDMIVSKFDTLRRAKEFKEQRYLPIRTVAAESGIAPSTIQRVNKSELENVTVATLGKLCAYFEVSSISDLIEWKPDSDALARASKTEER